MVIANIALIIFGYLLFLSKFFNIEAYGIDKAINNLVEGIVLLNNDKNIIDINESFVKMIEKAYPKEISDSKNIIKTYQLLLNKKKLFPNKEDLGYKNIEMENNESLYLNVKESNK